MKEKTPMSVALAIVHFLAASLAATYTFVSEAWSKRPMLRSTLVLCEGDKVYLRHNPQLLEIDCIHRYDGDTERTVTLFGPVIKNAVMHSQAKHSLPENLAVRQATHVNGRRVL
jgi:hypothetical protein